MNDDTEALVGAGCIYIAFFVVPASVLAGLVYAIVWIVRHA